MPLIVLSEIGLTGFGAGVAAVLQMGALHYMYLSYKPAYEVSFSGRQ